MSICNEVDWILLYPATIPRFPKLDAHETTLPWFISVS
jgi:hypothetical protein